MIITVKLSDIKISFDTQYTSKMCLNIDFRQDFMIGLGVFVANCQGIELNFGFFYRTNPSRYINQNLSDPCTWLSHKICKISNSSGNFSRSYYKEQIPSRFSGRMNKLTRPKNMEIKSMGLGQIIWNSFDDFSGSYCKS